MYQALLFSSIFNNNFNKEDLLEEISDLNQQVAKLMKEKDELMALKVSQLGLNPEDEDAVKDGKTSEDGEEGEEKEGRLSCIQL